MYISGTLLNNNKNKKQKTYFKHVHVSANKVNPTNVRPRVEIPLQKDSRSGDTAINIASGNLFQSEIAHKERKFV